MDIERTKRILAVLVIVIIVLTFVTGGAIGHGAKKDGRSNIRMKKLTSVYDFADKEHYSKYLAFPVERQCKTSDFIEPDEAASSELVSIWSDLLHKFSFANEELIPDKAVLVLEKVATESSAYKKLPFMPLALFLLYAVASVIYIILIPIIGCGLFHIGDLIWVYCISIAYRKLGRLFILAFYRSKIRHIKQIKPEQLEVHHFRVPKYFRNDDDAEELFADKQNEEALKDAAAKGQELKTAAYKQPQFIDSSDSDFDVERDYKNVVSVGEEEQAGGLTEEQRKAQRKKTRTAFQRAKGRRQSIRLLTIGLDNTSDEEEDAEDMTEGDLELWDFQVKDSALLPEGRNVKPLEMDPKEIQRAKKTLLQELRDERMVKLAEVRRGELEKMAKQGGV